jgi:hypothetical protein
MRTGGVDPSRLGRKKRSPKPRPKRPKPKQQDSTTTTTIRESENVTSSREDVSGSQEAGQESVVTEGIEYVNAPKERLATTPATPGEEGVVDISRRFQVMNAKRYSICTTGDLFYYYFFIIFVLSYCIMGSFCDSNYCDYIHKL